MAVDDFGPERGVAVPQAAPDVPSIIGPGGEVVSLSISNPLTVQQAVDLLPHLEATLSALSRYVAFVRYAVTDAMAKEKTPRLVVGERVAELVAEDGDWQCNGFAMRQALHPFVGKEITMQEFDKAVVVIEQPVLYKAYHNVLNTLEKRGSDALKEAIKAHREKPKKPPVLRIK